MKEQIMKDMHVNVTALNFRSQPEVKPETFIGTVFLGQKLMNVRETNVAQWVSCEAEIDGERRGGFVNETFLRNPMSPTREALVESVFTQWTRFGHGTRKENTQPFVEFMGEMWRAIG